MELFALRHHGALHNFDEFVVVFVEMGGKSYSGDGTVMAGDLLRGLFGNSGFGGELPLS